MAVNDDFREAIDPADARIAALYREAAVEEPPAHLGHEITANARRRGETVRARQPVPWWRVSRVPFAAIATALITASLVAVMWQQGADRVAPASTAPAPSAERASPDVLHQADALPQTGAGTDRLAESRDHLAEAPAGPTKNRAGSAPSRRPPASMPGPEAGQASRLPHERGLLSSDPAQVSEASSQATSEKGPGTDAPAPASAAPSSAAAVASSPVPGSAPPSSAPAPPPAARPLLERKALTASKQLADAQSPAAIASAPAKLIAELEGQPPARWIERIVGLRRDGRRSEADALIAEFKRRYGEERLPASLQRNDE
jgi:hypothetical protein